MKNPTNLEKNELRKMSAMELLEIVDLNWPNILDEVPP